MIGDKARAMRKFRRIFNESIVLGETNLGYNRLKREIYLNRSDASFIILRREQLIVILTNQIRLFEDIRGMINQQAGKSMAHLPSEIRERIAEVDSILSNLTEILTQERRVVSNQRPDISEFISFFNQERGIYKSLRIPLKSIYQEAKGQLNDDRMIVSIFSILLIMAFCQAFLSLDDMMTTQQIIQKKFLSFFTPTFALELGFILVFILAKKPWFSKVSVPKFA